MILLLLFLPIADDNDRVRIFKRSTEIKTKIAKGLYTEVDARSYLDLLHAETQEYIRSVLKRERHPRFREGHRQKKIGLVAHYTANTSFDGTIKYFIGEKSHASTHFVCDFDGTAAEIFSHRDTSFHAGTPFNDRYFGFDFVNAGYFKAKGPVWVDYVGREYKTKLPLFGTELLHFPEPRYGHKTWMPTTRAQVETLIVVGRALGILYPIETGHILPHSVVSKSRSDCGPTVPLARIREEIFSRNDLSRLGWLRSFGEEKDYMIRNPEPEYGFRGEEIKAELEKKP